MSLFFATTSTLWIIFVPAMINVGIITQSYRFRISPISAAHLFCRASSSPSISLIRPILYPFLVVCFTPQTNICRYGIFSPIKCLTVRRFLVLDLTSLFAQVRADRGYDHTKHSLKQGEAAIPSPVEYHIGLAGALCRDRYRFTTCLTFEAQLFFLVEFKDISIL